MNKYNCPKCKSSKVLLVEEHVYLANTLEHYCFAVKIQDPDAKSSCLDCDWSGIHSDLVGFTEEL